jgi:hypothetical protein
MRIFTKVKRKFSFQTKQAHTIVISFYITTASKFAGKCKNNDVQKLGKTEVILTILNISHTKKRGIHSQQPMVY